MNCFWQILYNKKGLVNIFITGERNFQQNLCIWLIWFIELIYCNTLNFSKKLVCKTVFFFETLSHFSFPLHFNFVTFLLTAPCWDWAITQILIISIFLKLYVFRFWQRNHLLHPKAKSRKILIQCLWLILQGCILHNQILPSTD